MLTTVSGSMSEYSHPVSFHHDDRDKCWWLGDVDRKGNRRDEEVRVVKKRGYGIIMSQCPTANCGAPDATRPRTCVAGPKETLAEALVVMVNR